MYLDASSTLATSTIKQYICPPAPQPAGFFILPRGVTVVIYRSFTDAG